MRIFGILVALAMLTAIPQQANAGTMGCLLGAGAGGFGGSQLGGGKGKLALTALGTLLGCGVGSSIQDSDQQRYQQQYQPRQQYQPQRRNYSMDYSYDTRRVPYSQPRYYQPQPRYRQQPQIVWQQPQQRVVRNSRYCREFQTEVIVAGYPQPAYGTACRQPDGSWKVTSWR